MIERLEGRLAGKAPTVVHLDVGPARFEIQVPLSTSRELPEEGRIVSLWTHLQWKEDGPSLFGFASRSERELFRLLILVPGVGPRTALSLLSHLTVAELVKEIRQRSVQGLIRVPGIGQKTAGRLLVEIGPRIDRLDLAGQNGR